MLMLWSRVLWSLEQFELTCLTLQADMEPTLLLVKVPTKLDRDGKKSKLTHSIVT